MEAAAAAGSGDGFRRLLAVLVFAVITSFAFPGLAAASSSFVGVNVRFPRAEADAGRLPKAELVVDLLQILQIQQIKLHHDAHPALLRALSGTEIEVLVTVPDHLLHSIAESQETASNWLEANVLRHFPSTKITGVVIGDELLTTNPDAADELVGALKKLHSCIAAEGLDQQIKLTTSQSSTTYVAQQSSMHRILDFLSATSSYLMINLQPYETFLQQQQSFSSSVDFDELIDAAIDATYAAMEKLGFSVPVVIGKVGWPWKSGDESDSSFATPETAAIFNENLVKRILGNHEGSALKKPSAYVHELFDIVLPGEEEAGTHSKRYGIFSTNLIPVYRFSLDASAAAAAAAAADVAADEFVMRRALQDNGTGNGNSSNGGGTGTGTGGTGTAQYCVAKPGASDSVLSVGLNWACGQGNADCTPIQQNGACYLPDTYASHASYAFNTYWQKNAGAGATCDFQGAAALTSTDPSHDSCIYTSSTGTSSGGGGSSGGPSSSSGGILQPFNPTGNTSSSSSLVNCVDSRVGAILFMAVLLWSWRF